MICSMKRPGDRRRSKPKLNHILQGSGEWNLGAFRWTRIAPDPRRSRFRIITGTWNSKSNSLHRGVLEGELAFFGHFPVLVGAFRSLHLTQARVLAEDR